MVLASHVGESGVEQVRSVDVVRVMTAMNHAGVDVWVDGGWGVDALAGRETRRHKDLDLLVAADDVSRVEAVLAEQGFGHVAGTSPAGVYRDVTDRRVDVSVVTPDPGGGGYLQETAHGLVRVAGEDLGGRGAIGGLGVRCLTASAQLRAHTGYEATAKDEHDLQLLRENEADHRFGDS